MSAVYKRLEREDTFITPYTAHKTFSFTSSSFDEVGIEILRAVSGTFPYTEDELRYSMVTNHFTAPTFFLEDNLDGELPFSSQLNVLSIPRNLYGTSLQKGSIEVHSSGSDPVYDNNGYLVQSGSNTRVGYVDYGAGLLILTGSDYNLADSFFSESIQTTNFEYDVEVYVAYTQSISIDPATDPNPFEPGGSDPTQEIAFLSGSHNFANDYIYGAGDINALDPAWYLAPKLTLTIGSQSISFFARVVDDSTSGKLALDFATNIYHPSVGVLDLSDTSDYSQLTSISLELKQDAPDTRNLTTGFLSTGSWDSRLTTYPNSSSLLEVQNNYDALIAPTEVSRLGRYVSSLSDVTRYGSTFTSSSLATIYTGGNYTASFRASEEILTYNYHCYVGPNEFNFTHNPSVLSRSSSGSLEGFATGSDFRPYATSVGIYNSANELLAVGKLGQATPILKDTPYTFVVKIDL